MALRDINLIPADVLHKRYMARHIFLWMGVLTFCLCLVAGFYQYQVRVVLPEKRSMATLEDMQLQLGSIEEEIKATRQEIQRLSLQNSFLKKLSSAQPFSNFLQRLSKIINPRTWLTKFSIDADTAEETAVSGVELYGLSLSNEDLGDFLTRLSNAPLFKRVELKYANEIRIAAPSRDGKARIKVIQFQIDCKIPKSQTGF